METRGKLVKKETGKRRGRKGYSPAYVRKAKLAILASIKRGALQGEAVKAASISRETLRKWRMEDLTFAKEFELAWETNIDIVEESIHDIARGGNLGACIFIVCNRRKDKWQSVMHVKAKLDAYVRSGPLAEMSTDELDKLLQQQQEGGKASGT